jgi:hypothetical protein
VEEEWGGDKNREKGGRKMAREEERKEVRSIHVTLDKCFQGKITITFSRIEPPKGKGMDICERSR